MADPSPAPAIPQRPGTPRWVKVIGIVLLGVLLLALAVTVIGGGQHGPGMHSGTGAFPGSSESDPSGHNQAVTRGPIALG
jgi:hypothetical protein